MPIDRRSFLIRGAAAGAAYVDMNDIAGETTVKATQTNVWQLASGTWSSGSNTSVILRCATDGTPNGPIWFEQISLTRQ
jgi:hypothetical protein